MGNNKLVYRKKKVQSLDAWVNEINGVTYDLAYSILIQVSHAISDIYCVMDGR